MPKPLNFSMVMQQERPERSLPIVWIKYIHNRLNRNDFNFTQVITGDTGTAKTTTGCVRAYLLNPRRFSESNLVQGAKEFLDFVEDSKTGDAAVWDETGIGLDKRHWYKLSNILTTHTLQTFREKNLALFFCTPDPSFIDSRAMKMINSFSEMKRWDRKMAYERLYNVSIDRKRGNIYYPWYSFYWEGTRYLLPTITHHYSVKNIIPKKIMKAINKKVTAYKEKVMKKAKQEAAEVEKERWEDSENKTYFDYVNIISEDWGRYMNSKGRIDWRIIMGNHPELSRDRAQVVQRLARKKISDSEKEGK